MFHLSFPWEELLKERVMLWRSSLLQIFYNIRLYIDCRLLELSGFFYTNLICWALFDAITNKKGVSI